MPVTINVNMYATLQKIGVNPVYLAQLAKDKWKISALPNGLRFHDDKGGDHTLTMSTTKLMAANKDMLDKQDLEWIKKNLNTFLHGFLVGGSKPSTEPAPPIMSTPESSTEKVDPNTLINLVGAYKEMLPMMLKHQPVTDKQMLSGDLYPLMDATGLYAPVRGTDKSSRYFLMAVFPGFRLAMRYKGSKQLSFRFEGLIPSTVKAALGAIHFTASTSHISQHCTVESPAEANRYLGAVIQTVVGAGAALLTPAPDVNKIAGKGV